ncbi:unnamed protein product, partial [Cyprideis torosa]
MPPVAPSSAKVRSLAERWNEVRRCLRLYVEIQEMNENGDYHPVEIETSPEVLVGGMYQLRQGHQRRLKIDLKPLAHDTGTLPLVVDSIRSVAMGCVRV